MQTKQEPWEGRAVAGQAGATIGCSRLSLACSAALAKSSTRQFIARDQNGKSNKRISNGKVWQTGCGALTASSLRTVIGRWCKVVIIRPPHRLHSEACNRVRRQAAVKKALARFAGPSS